jgi:hypothetical protein
MVFAELSFRNTLLFLTGGFTSRRFLLLSPSMTSRIVFIIFVSSAPSFPSKINRGVTYSRPTTGTGMPIQERFGTRPSGRASLRVLHLKLPVSSWTAVEAANLLLYSLGHIRLVRNWRILGEASLRCKWFFVGQNSRSEKQKDGSRENFGLRSGAILY